jgi:protein-disulfide isomerase
LLIGSWHPKHWALLLSASIIVILVLNSSFFNLANSTQKPNDQIKILSLQELLQSGSPFLGNKSVAVTVIDFSDFQCALCKRYVENTEPLINQTYIQTGKVILVFKHLPNRGVDSMGAALAAQCTNDQGKFWQFHNLLYSNQELIDSGWVDNENLKKFASQIPALDIQQFNSCFDSDKYKSFVQGDIDLASSFGFRETPSFIIQYSNGSNQELLAGALPFESFKAVIDKKLSRG